MFKFFKNSSNADLLRLVIGVTVAVSGTVSSLSSEHVGLFVARRGSFRDQ